MAYEFLCDEAGLCSQAAILRLLYVLVSAVYCNTDHPSLSQGVKSAVLANEYSTGAVSATVSSDFDDDSVLSDGSLITAEKDALPDFTASLHGPPQPGLQISSIPLSVLFFWFGSRVISVTITHSLFHSRLKPPFLQILPTAAFLFLLQDWLHGFPRLLLLLLSISVFTFLVFLFFSLFSFWFHAVD